MLKRIAITGTTIAGLGFAIILANIHSYATSAERAYTYLEVHALDKRRTINERFFEGPLPAIGQCAEMVYVGQKQDGTMQFQLSAKECGK
jgi:hypothetical protein